MKNYSKTTKVIILFHLLSMVFILLGCGGGSSRDTDNKNSDIRNNISDEYYSDEKKLFPSKKTIILYDPQDMTKEKEVTIVTFKYNSKNLRIEENRITREYNTDKITFTLNTKISYDNQDRYIGAKSIQEDFIPNQPKKTVHSHTKIKYKDDKIVEEYRYREEVLFTKVIVTEWDGDKPTKRQAVFYSEDGEEKLITTEVITYEGRDIIYSKVSGNGREGSEKYTTTIETDRVFDDKKMPDSNDFNHKYYTSCWSGTNNIISETVVTSYNSSSAKIKSINRTEQKLKYNEDDMLIEKEEHRYDSSDVDLSLTKTTKAQDNSQDYVFRWKTTIEYVER